MICPKCKETIDYVEEIGLLLIEGKWYPVLRPDPDVSRIEVNGASDYTVSTYQLRCPKCKEILFCESGSKSREEFIRSIRFHEAYTRRR